MAKQSISINNLEIELPNCNLFIGGEFTPALSGATFPVEYPGSEETIAPAAYAQPEDVNQAVLAARQAFESGIWSRASAHKRGYLLSRLADLVEKHLEHLARLETLDNGKPYSSALGDIRSAAFCLRYYGQIASTIEGESLPVSDDHLCITLREPYGVCGLIIPWNYPLLMAAWKLGPALAAGNTVILKPAEQTPLSALKLAELSLEAGLPPGVFNVVNGYGEVTGAAITSHPDIDKVAFTGSTATGKLIMQAAAQSNLKRVSLELGGKSPVILFPDAKLDAALEDVFDGIYDNQGQVCCAGSRLFAHKKIKEPFVEQLTARAQSRVVGDPFEEGVEQGPLVSSEQLERVHGYVESAKQQGARLLTGGERLNRKGYFYPPTVLDQVSNSMTVAREEVFGPVLSVIEFDDHALDSIIAAANDTDYGLAAAVYTQDMDRALYIGKRLKAGVVWLNCSQKFDLVAPFGGYKQSGFGRDLGRHALHEYTQIKTLWMRAKP